MPYNYINETGVIIPDTSTTLAAVQAEYRSVFGQDLDVSPETSQGVLIGAEVTQRDAILRNNAAIANQINPNIAGGLWLEAVCATTGLQRSPATTSVVTAQVSGVAGTVIPVQAQAKTAAGDIFEATGAIAIGSNGKGSGVFQSLVTGAIACSAGQLSDIVTSVLGWETVTNVYDSTIGLEQQNDVQLRNLRRNTLALQAQHTPFAITSALWNTAGVKGVLLRENVTDAPATIDGILIPAHSIYVAVNGGLDENVARVILNKKSNGCGYTGNTTVPVLDENSGQSFDVKFQRPTQVLIQARVTVKKSARSSIVTDIRYAIEQYAQGLAAGTDGLNIGTQVSPYEIAGAINILLPGVTVLNVEIGTAAGGVYGAATVPMSVWELPVLNSNLVTVVAV